jgi:hypothetical protein
MANAVATGGFPVVSSPPPFPTALPGAANATSNAETAKGAMAQAQSTTLGAIGDAQSTAETSLAGVRVTSTAVASSSLDFASTTLAVAQGGSGQTSVNSDLVAYAFSTGLPDKAYAATLIDGASNVADALLGPRDKVFGTAILGSFGGESESSSTFDFRFRGDLLLGLIDGSGEFSIDGVEMSFVDDTVINLGSNLGSSGSASANVETDAGSAAVSAVSISVCAG